MVAISDYNAQKQGSGSDEWGELSEIVEKMHNFSPYLNKLLNQQGAWLQARLDLSVEALYHEIIGAVESDNLKNLGESLRIAKARLALSLAFFDLGGLLPVLEITRYLTVFADFSFEKSLQFFLGEAMAKNQLPSDLSKENCGIFALAMGKQGAYELNYSSDCDVIFFYDSERFQNDDNFSVRRVFIKIVQNIVKLLSENTQYGYVFRVDLRLRPDPSVTPVVLNVDQAESYYEALGRTWERAAFIKARVCAGDFQAGEAFLQRLRPFIWRKYLDFAAIEDAHNMRLRIREHKSLAKDIQFYGQNLKLGRGGIREIEFFTQTRQLIFGGRNEQLRQKDTFSALQALAEFSIISTELSTDLIQDYQWLRRLEHGVQMLDDQQTHTIPENREKAADFLGLLGYDERFPSYFIKRAQHIDKVMDEFFEGSAEEDCEIDQDFQEIITKYEDSWLNLPVLRSERARSIFDTLKNSIYFRLSQAHYPQGALNAFDKFLRKLPAAVQLFSLFEANPSLLDLFVEICAIAPEEVKILSDNHQILEAVLSGGFFEPIAVSEEASEKNFDELSHALESCGGYEDVLDGVRKWAKEKQFRVSVHLMRGLIAPKDAGRAYSQIAECCVKALFPYVQSDIIRRYGKISGRGVAIIAMGKLGSQEMTRHSDLDLVFVYDAALDAVSDGQRALSAAAYYARFTQAMIQALTVRTSEGGLYEVDMRLRPSGNQGPIAVSMASFDHYQNHEAWTWEHMALLKARTIAGDQDLQSDIVEIMSKALSQPQSADRIKADAIEMRDRLRQAFPLQTQYQIKRGPGRLLELEILIAALSLIHNREKSGQSSFALLDDLKNTISPELYLSLYNALNFYISVQHMARLSIEGEPSPPLDQSFLMLISRLYGEVSAESFMKKLEKFSESVDSQFQEFEENVK